MGWAGITHSDEQRRAARHGLSDRRGIIGEQWRGITRLEREERDGHDSDRRAEVGAHRQQLVAAPRFSPTSSRGG